MNPCYNRDNVVIYTGDCLKVLEGLESESVDMCCTSPPYWGLRDYGENGQIGLEQTYHEYLDSLIVVFNEVKRVLKVSGSCWVNIGDSYAGSGKGLEGGVNKKHNFRHMEGKVSSLYSGGVKKKSLIGIPERFCIAMTDAGWIRRNTIIWHKRDCMPFSGTDRYTVDFEPFYFFVKHPDKYYFEQQFEERKTDPEGDVKVIMNDKDPEVKKRLKDNTVGCYYNNTKSREEIRRRAHMGRNKRCVWNLSSEGYDGAHFASYPTQLVYVPVKSCCPKHICRKCKKPRRIMYEKKSLERHEIDPGDSRYRPKSYAGNHGGNPYSNNQGQGYHESKEVGYSDCGCNAGWDRGVVIDPFMGSGTTLKVARDMGRKGIGIEINKDYVGLALKRINVEQGVLWI